MEELTLSTGFSNRAKIVEILKNLQSQEVNIYGHAAKEFIGLLNGEAGNGFLVDLIQLSPDCSELMDAWRMHQNKPGMAHILSLLATIIDHPAGKSKNVSVRKKVENFARLIVDSKLDDIYSELNTRESKRQSAALNLLASVVKRGVGLASEVAKNFDFKLPALGKLSGVAKKGTRESKGREPKRSSRRAFVNFAMSFVESANPKLLRWILQQRELFSGVLRGISNDDADTVVYVLSLFRDKVLNEEYLIPPGLRSVLFGSATLEQLSYLSGNPEWGAAADVAHQVLLMVCTDQRNGLMPGPGLRGNEKRLFDLMKKLKATQVASHRELILGIVCSSFSLCSAYFDEFPYHLEPRPSPSWISAISLVVDIVSSLDINLLIASLTSTSDEDGSELVLKCITPQVCSRLILNKGLLHASNLVRHGSLRLVLESLKILYSLIHAIDGIASRDDNKKWASMKCYIQDEVRASLPDPQVLVKLLSSKRQKDSKISGSRLKRHAESEPTEVALKKKKTVMSTDDDDDIMIGGVHVEPAESGKIEEKEGSESMSQSLATVYEIWGIDRESFVVDEEKDLEDIFQSKLLDVLTYYLRALPVSFDGTFDFIKIIPSDPSTLSSYEITSLLPLIAEYVLPGGEFDRVPESMYKHLQPLINIFLYSKAKSIRDQAYILVRAAMISTGAFEGNLWEIDCWFQFEQFFEASTVVIPFLCDAVSTLGNSLYKYMDQMRNLISDKKPGFSPLVLCILQKCLRLLDSESGSFKLYERSIISLYVCNTLSLILQSQVEMSMLPGLINSLLAEKLKGYSSEEKDRKLSLCEWRPLRNLFLLSQNVANQQYQHMFTLPEISSDKPLLSKSLFLVLSKVGELINRGQVSLLPNIANSFLFSVVCAKPDDLVENLPHVLSLAKEHFSSNFPFLALVLFLQRDNLARIVECWPELLSVGLEMLKGEILCSENVAGAFAKYLLESSFYTLFVTLVGCGYHADLIQSVELLELLRGKLSDRPVQEMTFCLKLVLFWGYHALSAYVSEPSDQMEGFSNLCFSLVEIIFDHLTISYSGAETCTFMRFLPLDLVDFLFEHPLITELLSSSLLSGDVLSNGGLDQLRAFSKENLPLVSRCLLRLLIKMYVFWEKLGNKLNLKAPKLLLKKIQLQFREMFQYCTEKSTYVHLLPVYCILRELLPFVSSSELLNLANWMLWLVENKAAVSGFGCEAGTALAFVCLQFADTAMEMLFRCDAVCNPFWDMKGEGFDFTNFQKVYYQILNSAFNLNLEFGDIFLYKAVERMYRCKYRESITSSRFYLAVLSSNILTNSPLKLINSCILPSSKVKTRILELIIESSPTHLKLFGKLLIGLMQKDPCILSLFTRSDDILEDDFVNLLPAALVYVSKSGLNLAQEILAFYAEILLNGFSKWKGFVTQHGLTEMHNQLYEPEIMSLDDFRGYFEKTLLGKAVSMLRYFLELNAASITKKQRLEIFDSIFPNSAEVIVSDLRKINSDSSIEETMRLRDVIHAKVSLARLLLSDKTALQMHSKKINSAKQGLISILVNSLDRIVRNVQQKTECLEHFILHNIVEIWLEAQSYLVQLKSLPFLNTFIRSSLLHRFNDPFTLKSLRGICTCLAEGSCSADEILELLLGHSQFVTAFTCDSSDLYPSTLLQPVPSIFKSLSFSSDSKCSKLTHGNSVSEKRKLELVRLLRVLYHFKIKQNCKGLQDESKELLFLLLSVYGATLRDIDLEILNLMQEVELSVGSNWGGIAEMDYLWGNAITKVREEMKVELHESENGGIEDKRKFLFRENIPVDSKMCVATASIFCYERSLHVEFFSIEKLLRNSVEDFEMPSPVSNLVKGYDPTFILQFSIHSLLMGYIEPIEFCRLGLLAITLVSMSSPDDELRKLGYESLATFKTSLENSGKGKDKIHIQLLLMYLQNGISEPWQKIPSVVAIFAAEASFTLLDASQHLFFTISKFLMRTSSVNLKSIPLFHTLFQSSSIHFKSDRIWILQLLYAGLNLHDDAKIYKKNSILEHLLNFYSSSASDPESRFLILVIVKKSVKLPALLDHLLKECGLLSWLSSVLSIYGEGIDSDNKHSAIVELVLEVVNASLSSRTVIEWLQDTALEQLSQMSSYLFKHLTRDRYSLTENISLVNAMLQVIVSTLRLSQKRKIYQPHFTFSLQAVVNLCRSIDTVSSYMESDETVLLALDVILMTTPPLVFSREDKLKFTEVLKWAVLASVRLKVSKEQEGKECIVSKILRWVTSSIIIGRISNLSLKSLESFHKNRMQNRSLDSLITYMMEGGSEAMEDCGVNETLGAMILYLQQIVGRNTSDNSSSVALCLSLLLANSSCDSAIYDGINVRDNLVKNRGEIEALCSKILCPAETNPSWRWSYYQAWRDLAVEQTEMEKLEEEQACQSLFILFSNAFGPVNFGLPVLSCNDLYQLGLFEWEDVVINPLKDTNTVRQYGKLGDYTG